MPLVNATSEARSSLKILIDTMPSLGSETTSSAAIAKRAIDLFTLEAKYGVMMMLGDLVSSAEDSFNGPSGVAAAAMKAANSIIYAFRMAWL